MKATHNFRTAVSILLILLTCLYALTRTLPRAQISESMPPTEFSVARALDHLRVIAQKPHYVGSPYHEQVREYLVSELETLGLEVEIQEEEVLGKKFRTATRVRNVLARIKGQGSGQALMLLSHYDSGVYSSLGASDAGSGVVAILESLRAFLARGEQPENDIIVLISDAEEIGLLGAQAFVDKHRWSKDVGLVLNFEARGSGGPVLMFVETNLGNEKLIRAFDEANTELPFSNSLFYSVYKLLPNDTDMTIFRKYGNKQGYNFAFIDDHFDYHTSQDNIERLDRNTLQHLGSYLMPALQHYSRVDLGDLHSQRDLVFFNFPGAGLISYPFSWVLPMILFGTLLLLILVILGIRTEALSLREIGMGFVPLLIVLPVIGLVSFYGWQLLLKIHPLYREMQHGFTYNGHLYIAAFVSLGLWFTLKVYMKFLERREVHNLYIAALVAWLLLNLGGALYLPGAGFLMITVITGILILGIHLFYGRSNPKQVILSTVVTLPMLLILVPLVDLFTIALGMRMILISTLLASLILILLLPVLSTYSGLKNLNKFFLILSLLTFASASYSSGFTQDAKRPDSILYVLNSEDSKAYWGSRDLETDQFTRQFLGENPVRGSIPDATLQAAGISQFNFHAPASLISLPPSSITVLKDSTGSGKRFLKVKFDPTRAINRMDVRLRRESRVLSLEVQGENAVKNPESEYLVSTDDGRELFRYYFTDTRDPVFFSYSVPMEDDPSLFLFEISFDLQSNPEILKIKPDLLPRSERLMAKPFTVGDAILNVREINF